MKNTFKHYLIYWIISFIAFNALFFIFANNIVSICIVADITFLILLVCGYITFKDDNLTKIFYRLPLIKISSYTLLATLVISIIEIIFKSIPSICLYIAYILIITISLLGLVKANANSEIISEIDKKQAEDTSFIKEMILLSEQFLSSSENKETYQELYECFKYSDPISSDSTKVIEKKVKEKMDQLKNQESNDKQIKEIIQLVKQRNNLCKRNKYS